MKITKTTPILCVESIERSLPFWTEGMGYERTDVDSVESARSALKGATLLVPERKTFYGAKEIFVRDPDGNVLGFAEHE